MWKVEPISKAEVEPDDPCILLDKIREEWDRAEGNIKQAETIQGELCLPAVNELRYAGRRLIDAWVALRENRPADATAKFNDAKFDCYRARHDSIDVISSKIAKDIEITVATFGIEVVVNAFASYSDLLTLSYTIQENIEKSRAKREDREAIYATVEACDIDPLIRDYRKFRLSESIMVQLAEAGREKRFYEKGGFWVALVLGISALVEGYFLWLHPR